MTADGATRGASVAFRDYLTEVGRDLAAGYATEHTHRPALKALVIALDPDVRPVNEPKRIECGAPDFIVTRNALPVGYIEAKDVGRSLDEIERDEQLKRYRESLSNLILTDYLEFRWYRDGEKQQTARIAYVGDSGKLQPDREGQKQAAAIFGSFLAQQPPIVGKPEDLAKRMAALTRIVRDIVAKALEHDRSGGSPLSEQLEGFRRVLIHDLGEEQFADMYAQTIAYGLFAARVNAPADEHFSRQHAAYDLPKTNPFLRQMFGQIAGPELDERIAWAVDDLAELLARARMDLVLEDFGKRTRQEDPVVHFYETFLAAYDRKMRQARGVYDTPEPVVSYIVRSVDHILRTEFGLPDGLADNSMIEVAVPSKPKETRLVHKVQILDPACGIGTFLAQVIETIRDTVVAKHGAGMWPGYVHDHLLPRLYGFELLMAPYAIAHLKLGLRLKETGYDIEQSERLRVYLTNSLEDAAEREHGQLTIFGAWLAEEADRASEVKRELPIMVILGNPPYSGISANMSAQSAALIDDYKVVDGKPLGERKHWLQDDYVKFIRMAQLRLLATGYGVLAYVSNHGYIDNVTFRGMRQNLLGTFDSIYVLDLHGNAKKRETAPDGSPDDNVFDIQQGVAIGVFVRRDAEAGTRGDTSSIVVQHSDLWGSRQTKYARLLEDDTRTTRWQEVRPSSPNYFFADKSGEHDSEYSAWPSLADAFGMHGLGFQSSRDGLVVAFAETELLQRIEAFLDPTSPDDLVRRRFFGDKKVRDYLPGDTRQWSLSKARLLLRQADDWRQHVRRCLYRPFDIRSVLFDARMIDWPRPEVLGQMLRPNRCLIANRQSREPFSVLVWNGITERKIASVYDASSTFPLYVTADEMPDGDGGAGRRRVANTQDSAVGALAEAMNMAFEGERGDLRGSFGADDWLEYVYAVFHSPEYRKRYDRQLRIDFPRVPLTSNRELFRELCRLGARLVTLHLMEADGLAPITTYPVPGDNRVERVRYTEPGQGAEQGRVWISATQYFEGVPPEVWEFHVGGYQVCAKWLKDRKGRQLSYDDLTHYQYVVAALAETIVLMREIDEAIEAHGGWPLI
ncbi:MAG: type ISP restriction/modification enzyme [Actinomycetes bacterium]